MSSHVSELTGHLARFSDRCRTARWFGPLFHVGVAQDIVADVAADQAKIRATVTEAQNFDLEALAQIERATAKDSDGGCTITPKELRRIRPLIVKSATLDNQVATMTEPA
jgi:hypothetical protein